MCINKILFSFLAVVALQGCNSGQKNFASDVVGHAKSLGSKVADAGAKAIDKIKSKINNNLKSDGEEEVLNEVPEMKEDAKEGTVVVSEKKSIFKTVAKVFFVVPLVGFALYIVAVCFSVYKFNHHLTLQSVLDASKRPSDVFTVLRASQAELQTMRG